MWLSGFYVAKWFHVAKCFYVAEKWGKVTKSGEKRPKSGEELEKVVESDEKW